MKILLLFLLLFSSVFSDNLGKRLENLIHNQKVKKITILKYDPFFTKQEIKKIYKQNHVVYRKTKKNILRLVSILGNKAFVNHRWLGVHDVINGYKVDKILQNSVLLHKKNKTIVLRFKKSKEILKVREK